MRSQCLHIEALAPINTNQLHDRLRSPFVVFRKTSIYNYETGKRTVILRHIAIHQYRFRWRATISN